MSAIDLAAALEAVRLGEATQEHAAVLAAEVERLRAPALATVERFVVLRWEALSEPQRLAWRTRYCDDHSYLVDAETGRVLGSDGGEPEDQTLLRDWDWVPNELNVLATELAGERLNSARHAEHARRLAIASATVRAERDAALEEQRRAVARLAEVSAERDAAVRGWLERLRDVARLLGYERTGAADFGDLDATEVCELVRIARAERDRLLAVVVAQAEAWDLAKSRRDNGGPVQPRDDNAWINATVDTEALGRALRGSR